MFQRLDNPLSSCDLKFAKGDAGIFEGYLSVFDSVDSYGDTVIKGAFADTLEAAKQLPPMLLNHNGFDEIPIGVWKAMREDDHGLRVKGELTPGNFKSEQVFAALKHGALTGLSIGYRKKTFEENDNGGFNLIKVELREGSVVTMPAEDQARIDTVKFEEEDPIESWKDIERLLRDAGYSRQVSKLLVDQVKSVALRDAEDMQNTIAELKSQLDAVQRSALRADKLQKLTQAIRGN